MEVQLNADIEKKLNDLATESGRGKNELVQDALAGYLDELTQTRDMLSSRYDDLESQHRSAAQPSDMSSGYGLHPEAYADLDDIRGYIAQESPDAADRVMSEVFGAIRGLVPFPQQGHRTKSLCGLSR